MPGLKPLPALMLLAVLLSACSSDAGGEPSVVDRIKAMITENEGALVLRYNPSSCACPPFEVQVDEQGEVRWIRVKLEESGNSEARNLLLTRAASDHSMGEVRSYRVSATLSSGTVGQCSNYLPFASLKLEQFTP